MKKPVSNSTPKNMAASVQARLLDRAKKRGEDYNYVLSRYANERLLYRLSKSAHAGSFVLKGATLFLLWQDAPHRPTRDLDLLGTGDPSMENLKTIFQEIVAVTVEDDGLAFNAALVTAEHIKEDEEYEGVRIKALALLGKAQIHLQIDVGFGDAITPAPDTQTLPTLLEQPAPVLTVYPRETVVAEKFQAMVKLGYANSRMKDFYDVWVLSKEMSWQNGMLRQAIERTFTRRHTELPSDLPLPLSEEFASNEQKQSQWKAFCRKQNLEGTPDWVTIIAELRAFLWPLRSD